MPGFQEAKLHLPCTRCIRIALSLNPLAALHAVELGFRAASIATVPLVSVLGNDAQWWIHLAVLEIQCLGLAVCEIDPGPQGSGGKKAKLAPLTKGFDPFRQIDLQQCGREKTRELLRIKAGRVKSPMTPSPNAVASLLLFRSAVASWIPSRLNGVR